VRPEYPFSVERTGNKPNDAAGFLPVYSKFRIGGTKVTTVIRKVKGDHEAFVREIRAVLKIHNRKKNIRIRAGDVIEVNGKHVREMKTWLANLGF